MSIRTTNPFAGNAVCCLLEGSNQGNTSSIVLKESNVRSAVYRSIPNRKRGRKPLESNLFFYVLESAANASNTKDSHNLEPSFATSFWLKFAAVKPAFCLISPTFLCNPLQATHFLLSHNILEGMMWIILMVGKGLQEVCSRHLVISPLSVLVRYRYNGRMHHVSNVP